MSKSNKPSGLSVTRNGNTYKLAWKIGDSDYGNGQNLWYRINDGGWAKPSISATATSYSFSNANAKKIYFQVRGNRKKYKKKGKSVNPSWSDWAGYTWTAAKPKINSLEYENTTPNSGKFSWEVNNKTNDTAVLDTVRSYTTIVRGTSAPTSWGSATNRSAKGEVTITEDTTAIAAGNFVRWFKIEAIGNAGTTVKTASHAYGAPSEPQLTNAVAVTKGSYTQITASWNDFPNSRFPIDKVVLQYAIDSPTDVDMSAPSSGWSDAIELSKTNSSDKIVVNVDDAIGADECLWVRVMLDHDGNASYSNALLAQTGKLTAPTINATPNTTSGDVAISITEGTSVAVANTAIFFRPADNPSSDKIVAIFPHGTTSGTINVPEIIGASTTCFGAYAFVGTYDSESLIVEPKMVSNTVTDSDIIAVPPANVTIIEGPRDGTVRVGWEWSWAEALSAEISWSEYSEAWESTDEPSSYTVENKQATSWVVAGLEVGKTWYFRVRLIGEDGDNTVEGPWSQTVAYNLSSVPDRPALSLSKSVINEGGSVTARWAYSATGDTEQAYAEICLVTFDENNEPVYGDVIASTSEGQSVVIEQDWATGTTYYLSVRVTTTAGLQSAWSEVASVYVAEPVTINMTVSSIYCGVNYTEEYEDRITTYVDDVFSRFRIESNTIIKAITNGMTSELYEFYNLNGSEYNVVYRVDIDEHTYEIHNKTSTYTFGDEPHINVMPFTATITGAGDTGTTVLSIVRAEDYHLYRPDDKDYDGYEGETIVTFSQTGEAPITITVDDLIGRLDDGAKYTLIATVIDDYGQTVSDEYLFTVNWMRKAVVPDVEVQVDKYLRIAKITPIAVTGIISTDTCDIYRITADQPELVYKGATFGETYVDPYPAFGDFCGHRLVTVTANGDYTSASGLAWYDTDSDDGDLLEEQQMIIDVDGEQIELPYNLELSNKWNKDFKRTSYLGGSVQGDWNPAVTRDLSADTVLIRGRDLDRQLAMRDLAGYAGVAHVRTPDGSSLTCDIQISESQSYETKKVTYSMTIQAVDPQEPAGLTLAEWDAMHNELE